VIETGERYCLKALFTRFFLTIQ